MRSCSLRGEVGWGALPALRKARQQLQRLPLGPQCPFQNSAFPTCTHISSLLASPLPLGEPFPTRQSDLLKTSRFGSICVQNRRLPIMLRIEPRLLGVAHHAPPHSPRPSALAAGRVAHHQGKMLILDSVWHLLCRRGPLPAHPLASAWWHVALLGSPVCVPIQGHVLLERLSHPTCSLSVG